MTCNRPIRYHTAQSETIYYVMCALLEFLHSLSLRCAIELFIFIELCSALTKSSIFINNRRFCLVLINGGFVSFAKSAVLSHSQNRRFCLVFRIGDIVSLSKSVVLSRLKNGGFVSHPKILLQLVSRLHRKRSCFRDKKIQLKS